MTTAKPKKKGGCFSLFLLTILAMGGGYYFGKKFLLGEELTLQRSNQIIPESTIVNTFISTNEEKWGKISEFGTPEAQQIIKQNWQKIVDDNLPQEDQKIDYQEDILPWLGGVSLAFLPSPTAGIDYSLVAILGVKNRLKAYQFVQKIKDNNKEKFLETKHQNIRIYQINDNNKQIFVSFFNNNVVITDKENSVKEVIDTYKGGVSLADVSSQNISSDNSIIQIYLPDYNNWLWNIIKDVFPDADINKYTENQLQKIDSILTNLSIENHGLKMRSIIRTTEPMLFSETIKPVSNNLLSQIPKDSLCVMTGNGISQLWQGINQEKQNIPDLEILINQAKAMTLQWLNLELDKDIFSWLDGEFALALTSTNEVNSPATLQGLFLLESSNRSQGESTFKSLENRANFFPFIEVNQKRISKICTRYK